MSLQGSCRRAAAYVSTLEALAAILARNGHAARSKVVGGLAGRINGGEPPSILLTTDIWGGSGSVTDCSILSGPVPSNKSLDDERQFCETLVALADLLAQDGLADSLVRSRRQTFSFWARQRTT